MLGEGRVEAYVLRHFKRPLRAASLEAAFGGNCGTAGSRAARGRRPMHELLESRLVLGAGPLVVSELMAANDATLADRDGDFSDWIEIHNPTTAAVGLDGWYLTDAAAELDKWRFPDVSIGVGEDLVVFASGKDRRDAAGELHTNFQLDADGEYLALVRPDGQTVAYDFAPEFASQREDVSYGRTVEAGAASFEVTGQTYHVPTADDAGQGTAWTALEFDDSSWSNITQPPPVLITEIGTATPDYLEIQNLSDGSVDTSGWVVALNNAQQGKIDEVHTVLWQLPDSMAAGELLYRSDDEADVEHFWGENIWWSTAGEGWAVMLDDGGNLVDVVVWGYDGTDFASLQVSINGFDVMPGRDFSGDSVPALPSHDFSLQRGGGTDGDTAADWSAVAPPTMGEQNLALLLPFPSVRASGIGFDRNPGGLGGLAEVDVTEQMHGVNASLWTRIPFTVDDPRGLDSLQLQIQYNDGFAMYLNGREVTGRNAPEPLEWNSTAAAPRTVGDSLLVERIDVTDALRRLRPGTNVLALHGLNADAADDNFLLRQALEGSSLRYFLEPTPGAPNGTGVIGFVKDTTFSVDRGFYDEPFQVEIATNTPGATIRYTLDGSAPTAEHGAEYTGPLTIDRTSTLRAMALKAEYVSTNVDSQTYLFLDDVKTQTRPPGYPTATEDSRYQLDYDVDPRVVNDPDYADGFLDDLLAIPSVSLVMDVDDLFGRSRGIYANAIKSGPSWERTTSMEYLDPATGDQFQIDSAIRIQGAYSRYPEESPKHAFRLIFKEPYGPTKLQYRFFEESPVDRFDQLILRMSTHDAWHVHQNPWRADATYAADQWHRYTQLAMGHLSGHSRHVHLYLNGLYWGLYEIEERPNASFAASHLGGQREDYDAVNGGQLRDGTLDAWNTMNRIANGQGQYGSIANDAAYQQLKGYLDVVSFADYLVMNIYSGNMDWPGKNYYAVRKREPGAGFQFVAWDSEASFWKSWGGNPPAANAAVWNGLDYPFFNTSGHGAGYLYNRLKNNAEFRMLLADRLHRHLDNDGILTPARAAEMYQRQLDKVYQGLVPESARWGDAWRPSRPYTRDAELAANVAWLFDQFFPLRSDNVLGYFRDDGMYPHTAAPSFSRHGGDVPFGFELSMSAPSGTIYYTLGDSDPRQHGGTVSPNAVVFDGVPIALTETAQVNARALDGGQWSALSRALFIIDVPAAAGNLAITELNYDPFDPTPAEAALGLTDNDEFEFIELRNIGRETIDLSGVRFTDGVAFGFSDGEVTKLAPDEMVVVARDAATLQARYGAGINLAGSYAPDRLKNEGERITLLDHLNRPIHDFQYNDAGPWPGRANGKGSSLEVVDPAGDYDHPHNWRSSREYGGTPGRLGSGPVVDVVVNEVLSNTDSPSLRDAIELHNTTDVPVNLSGWYLSDSWGSASNSDNGNYKKFRIPDGTIIGAGGYLVFDEDDFNPSGGVDPELHPEDFALDGSRGDDVWLMEADATGKLTRFVDHVQFGAAADGESLGRWPNGSGDLYPMVTPTLDKNRPQLGENDGPRVGPVVISEVHYHPAGAASGGLEFVEIYNSTTATIGLADWRLRKDVDFDFPNDAVLDAKTALVVVPFDVSDAARLSAFRTHYGLDASVQIVGGYSGSLGDDGGSLQLQRPGDRDPLGFVPRLLEDEVIYDDGGDWPTNPDGHGDCLHRSGSRLWGNRASGWTSAPPTPGSVDLTARVIARHVFYNNSTFDGNDAGASPEDDLAIAPDKEALLPGETATFANYTSYSSGINGIIVDVADLAGMPGVDEFQFKVGNSDDPGTWSMAPVPMGITVRPGKGFNNSDRVTLIWPNGAIARQWLQVAVLATENTGLAEADVLYFGNAIGETGDSTGDAKVTAVDMLAARDNQRNFLNPAEIDSVYDFNRDARVNSADMLITRDNQTHFLSALQLITVPDAKITGVDPVKAEHELAHDAVLQRATQQETSPAKLNWLHELEGTSTRDRPPDDRNPLKKPVEALLASLGSTLRK